LKRFGVQARSNPERAFFCLRKWTSTMAFENLREFLAAIEKRGELVRVKEKVSPILEITEWARPKREAQGSRAAVRECGRLEHAGGD
jgi:hypothetical protein